jgi:hypothetical protein
MTNTRLLTATLLTMALLAVASPGKAAAAPKAQLTVHVFTRVEAGGFTDAAEQQRLESVWVLRQVLLKHTKRFQSVLVGAPEEAQIIIEVTSSEMENLGARSVWNPATGFLGGSKVKLQRVIRGRLRVGAYERELAGASADGQRGNLGTLAAATAVQREFQGWADMNATQLLESPPTQ